MNCDSVSIGLITLGLQLQHDALNTEINFFFRQIETKKKKMHVLQILTQYKFLPMFSSLCLIVDP